LTAIVVLFALFLVVLWEAGFFHFTGTDPSSKVVTGSLAVVGAFVTALLALLGAILKLSSDHQTELRLAAEGRDAAARLQLEAAVKAVQLLATTNGQPSPSIQRAGALFALATLRQFDLTLALTSELLAQGQVEAGAAARLINLTLIGGDDAAQRQASDILASNAKRFLTESDVMFPQCLLDGEHTLAAHAREWTSIAMVRAVVAREADAWVISTLVPLIAALAIAYENEEEERLKNDVGVLLGEIIRAFPEIDQIIHPRRVLALDDIRNAVADMHPVSANIEMLADEVHSWGLRRTRTA
jgi:hypothetical protein